MNGIYFHYECLLNLMFLDLKQKTPTYNVVSATLHTSWTTVILSYPYREDLGEFRNTIYLGIIQGQIPTVDQRSLL